MCCVLKVGLVILLFFIFPDVSFSFWQVKQFPDSLAAQKDSEVILNCFVTGDTTPSKVKWLRQDIVNKTHVFSRRPEAHESNDPRMGWALKYHTINYALRITNITFTDIGTYYCVAYGRGDGKLHSISGKGTFLSVKGKTGTITGPARRVKAGDVVQFICEVNDVDDFKFTWLKNGKAISQEHFDSTRNGSLHTSHLSLQTERDDIRSVIQCGKESCENESLSAAFNLSSVLTVMPQLSLERSTNVTSASFGKYLCRVDGFYPEDIQVTWTLGNHTLPSCCEKSWSHTDGTLSTICHIHVDFRKLTSEAVLHCRASYCLQCCPKGTGRG
ncbi:tyrosine-protein phosphatase non-receptor type substrate 1-like [Polypterus senegalus]|uniref:tyrosine-protein phosphatase non-receptor type substrate 1-like n=1 Tax=Polypterus senegalus TaxID=55291 RepID=UPI001962D316|nr:tyrosine-protein phosphatase non-receptor type substrate 1-like [Polypterus senegalus]